MKKFFENKKNLILVILIGVSILSVILASFISIITPFSCIICGITCLYFAYILLLKYVSMKNSKVSEFMGGESEGEKRKTKFIEAEGRTNVAIFTLLCAAIGLFLIYFGVIAL